MDAPGLGRAKRRLEVKAFIHTPEGDYAVEANFFSVVAKGDVVTLFGASHQTDGLPIDAQPVATIKLSAQTFILYGDEHPPKREVQDRVG
jgi:hypothetical protein